VIRSPSDSREEGAMLAVNDTIVAEETPRDRLAMGLGRSRRMPPSLQPTGEAAVRQAKAFVPGEGDRGHENADGTYI